MDREPRRDHPEVNESPINGVRSREINPNTPITYAAACGKGQYPILRAALVGG